jgi:hypothetical protein
MGLVQIRRNIHSVFEKTLEPVPRAHFVGWHSARPIDRIRQMELTMAADPVDSELEAESAYWKRRVANLEMLLCELLVKNERLRQEHQMSPSMHSDQGTALTRILNKPAQTG